MRRNADLGHLSDTAMMNAIKEGDTAAETELYKRFNLHINRVARRLTQDSELVKDIAQESLLAILKHIRKSGTVNDLKNYSASIVIHTFRKLSRNQPVVKGASAIPLDTQENFTPEALIYNDPMDKQLEVLELVETAAVKLSPESIKVLKDHFIKGCSYQEIARKLGKNNTHVRVIAHRTVKKIKETSLPARKK